MTEPELISIAQAAAAGIERVRQTIWANPMDHLKIDIITDGHGLRVMVGPWLHLYCPYNQQVNGSDPVDFLWMAPPLRVNINEPLFVPYTGPLPESVDYKKEVARFERPL